MKEKKPIYVSAEMNTTMEKLWEYTQEPNIHTEWDARFTEILYLEKKEGETQKFLSFSARRLHLICVTGETEQFRWR
ncbi:hypothetical protein ACMZ5A_12610 [Bacillus mobilis]|uniref:hypothetical protein n=1 Tax=Bacillus mobilis TaxID=2026190 RepID=UPI0035E31429